METNNDNKKIEELTDEQLKQVAGGLGIPCSGIPHCKTQAHFEPCGCQECEDGYVPWTSSRGVQECKPDSVEGEGFALPF